MRHPIAAALILYARFSVDSDHRVARHIGRCVTCAEFVKDEQLHSPSSAVERRVLGSLARKFKALAVAAAAWAEEQ